MNQISFDGRVAADAELRYTTTGEPVLGFRVASDIGFGDRKTTNWFSCQVWGKRAESLAPFLRKGQQLTVYGQLTLREWQDDSGAKRLTPQVRVNEISLQGSKRSNDAAAAEPPPPPGRNNYSAAKEGSRPTPAPKFDDMDDDIPF